MQIKKTRLASLSVLAALLVGMMFMSAPEYVGAQDGVNSADAPDAAVGTAFTYQGRLTDNGNPASGEYDFVFELYDTAEGNTQVGATVLLEDVVVEDGYFNVEIDFGSVFNGNARYLKVSARPGSGEDVFTVLSPRRKINPSPLAIYADKAGYANKAGTAAVADEAKAFTNGNKTLNGTLRVNGATFIDGKLKFDTGDGRLPIVMLHFSGDQIQKVAISDQNWELRATIGRSDAFYQCTVTSWFANFDQDEGNGHRNFGARVIPGAPEQEVRISITSDDNKAINNPQIDVLCVHKGLRTQ